MAHKRRFGLRLSPRDLLALWQDTAPHTAPSADELILALDQLHEWEAVDRQADTGRAGSTAEFKRARNTYDITAAGEASWEAAQKVLDARAPGRFARASSGCGGSPPRSTSWPSVAQAAAGRRPARRAAADHAARRDRRDGAGHLRVHARAGRGDDARRAARARAVPGLQGARRRPPAALRPGAARVARAVHRRGGARWSRTWTPLVDAIVAAGGQVAGYRQAPEQAERLRAAAVREDWRQAHDWLVGSGETTPWEQLRRTINGAVDWLLDTWNRMATERSGRLDRSSDYRRLAQLLVEDPDVRPGAVPPRVRDVARTAHLVPDPDEDQLADPAAQSWWTRRGPGDGPHAAPARRAQHHPGPHAADPGRRAGPPLAQLEADEEAQDDRAAARPAARAGRQAAVGARHRRRRHAGRARRVDHGVAARARPGPRTAGRGGSSTPAASSPSRSPRQPGRARLRTAAGKWDLEDLQLEVAPA